MFIIVPKNIKWHYAIVAKIWTKLKVFPLTVLPIGDSNCLC